MIKVVIFGNEFGVSRHDGVRHLCSLLSSRGIAWSIERQFASHLPDGAALPTFDASQPLDAQFVLSLGGDGTFLTAVMYAAPQGIPIVGINMGHLGYLTAYSIDDVESAVADLVSGHYRIEERTMLTASCDRQPIAHPYALNDIAILRNATSSTIEMHTTVRDVPLTTYKGDGLVVCTPTGSTAYNLSAGGPILEPSAASLVLTPVSPHSLSMRPVVVSDDSVITIVTTSRSESYQVSLDGEGTVCPSGSTVTIERASFKARVVQRLGAHFAHTLRQKLAWGL